MKNINYRLGVIGTGRIAHRFVPEARMIEGIEVTAVYNPRRFSADAFAVELDLGFATDNLEEFADRVDAVYIATPHETHVAYCRQMLEAGKHVLCEKPMSFSKKDAEALFALASEKKLVLMEGMKTAYCPGFKALLEIVRSGKIGRVVDVEACFSRISQSNVREVWDEEYGGSFTEFGTYPLLPIVKLLGVHDKNVHKSIFPEDMFVSGRTDSTWALQAKNGVDIYTKTFFDYGTATAVAKTGLAVKSEGQLVIAGTKGYVLVPSPWWLTKYFEVRYEDPNKIEKFEFPYEGAGLRYEVQELVERIKYADSFLLKGNGNNNHIQNILFGDKADIFYEDKLDNSLPIEVEQSFPLEGNCLQEISLTPEESIWFAEKMEWYLEERKQRVCIQTEHENKQFDIKNESGISNSLHIEKQADEYSSEKMTDKKIGRKKEEKQEATLLQCNKKDKKKVGIWAHRGCSLAYPENTLSAFHAAAELDGITGIELDVQLTKDDVIVVIHDETVDRTTNGCGKVKDFTLKELKTLEIVGKDDAIERIPTMEEVFLLLKDYCFQNGLLINIELKNGKIRYEGMEEMLLEMVRKFGLENYIVYSSFLPESMKLLKELDASVKTGILGSNIAWCYEKAQETGADAVHPWNGGLELVQETVFDNPVRVWNGEEPFFGQSRILREKNMIKYAKLGATDIITNVPEMYIIQ